MSPLSAAAKYGEVARAHSIAKQPEIPVLATRGTFRREFEEKRGKSLMELSAPPREALSLHHLAVMFRKTGAPITPDDFIKFIVDVTPQNVFHSTSARSVQQASSSVWYELRYGRITASILYETAHCKKLDGSLVERIMGASPFVETEAMKRGKDLEEKVLKRFKGCSRPGLFISESLPFLGASPDGMADDFVIEVKCPSKLATVSNFIDVNNVPTPKCMAQMTLQMKLARKKKCKFCVASPTFETDEKVTVVDVFYNELLAEQLISDAYDFWCEAIFPKLFSA